MDKNLLLLHMTERFRSLYGQVLDAVEGNTDLRRDVMIEVAFHDALLELMRQSLLSAAELDPLDEWDPGRANQTAPDPGDDGPRSAA